MLPTAALFAAPETLSQGLTIAKKLERNQRPVLLKRIPAESVVFGMSPDENSFKGVLEYEEKLKHLTHLTNFFAEGDRPFSRNQNSRELLEQIKLAVDNGKLVMLSHGLSFGDYDLNTLTEELKRIDAPFIFRVWYEKNGSWTDNWYGKIADYEFIERWQEMFVHFSIHLPQAYLLFCPNTTEIASDFEPIFPHNYVHMVGLDAYHRYSPSIFNARHYIYPNLTPEETLGPDIAKLQRLASRVPFILCEVGSIDDPKWFAKAIDYSVKAGARGWLTFDWNKAGVAWDEHDLATTLNEKQSLEIAVELGKSYYFTNYGGVDQIERTLSKIMAGSALISE